MSNSRLPAVTTAALLLSVAIAACGGHDVEPGVQPSGLILSDADVSSIFANANAEEIQTANLALTRSSNTAVREFAQRMITDHTRVNQQLEMIMRNRNMQTRSNTVTQQQQSRSSQAMQSLQQLQGADFDRAYIADQVAIHQWLLQTIDQVLIPSARDRDLERLLTETRPTIASHLEQARQIQNSLGR